MAGFNSPVLDAPDTAVRRIMLKREMGQPVTRKELDRLATRMSVERQTMREGGTVQQPVSRVPLTARQQGAQDREYQEGYNAGRTGVMPVRPAPPTAPGGASRPAPPVSPAPVPKPAPVAAPRPATIRGRYNGQELGAPAASEAPTGTSRLMGRDGVMKEFRGGALTPVQPARPAPTPGSVRLATEEEKKRARAKNPTGRMLSLPPIE